MTKSRAKKFAVSFLACCAWLMGTGVAAVSSAEEGKEGKDGCPAPVCSEIQRESGWFEEVDGECVVDLEAALKDLKASIDADQKLLSSKSAEDFAAAIQASEAATRAPGGTIDVCIGPVIFDGACGASCSDCMCCVYCWGRHWCWSRAAGGAAAVSRMTRE